MHAKLRRAFSLIELMVVVAIVGVLSAIVTPYYGDYITRSKLTNGLVILEHLKKISTEHYSINGIFPDLADTGSINTDFSTDIVNWGDMGASGWAGGDAGSPYVEVQFASDTVEGQTAPRLAFIGTLSETAVSWNCYTYEISEVDSSISTKFLPSQCIVHP